VGIFQLASHVQCRVNPNFLLYAFLDTSYGLTVDGNHLTIGQDSAVAVVLRGREISTPQVLAGPQDSGLRRRFSGRHPRCHRTILGKWFLWRIQPCGWPVVRRQRPTFTFGYTPPLLLLSGWWTELTHGSTGKEADPALRSSDPNNYSL